MKRLSLTLFLFPVIILSIYGSVKTDTLKIGVITDLHYLSPKLVVEGDALSAYESSTGRNRKDLDEVFDKVLDDIISEDIDILLVTGDITNHGEKSSHIGFLEKISVLQESGVRVFVTPGNHDINIPDAKAYIGVNATPAESITKEEFTELYKSLGYNEALKEDVVSLSYLSEINEDTWLLSIDTNRYDEYDEGYISAGRIKPQTLEWILKILKEAESKGIRVLGMMHHGLLEHMLYQSTFFPDYIIEDWQETAGLLADAGLEVVFTGHFHSNDVTLRSTPSRNKIYDVETASLAQYPFAYRIMKLSDTDLSIDTRFVTKIPSNPDLADKYYRKLEESTRKVINNKLINLDMPFANEMRGVITDLMVKLSLAHVRGDEKADTEIMSAVQTYALFLGNEVEVEDYTFDFPPADNKLVIEFRFHANN